LFLFGKFEYEIIKTIRELNLKDNKNTSILDIGANIGAHSLQIAQQLPSSNIYSIEPTDFAYNKFLVNLSVNTKLARNIHPHQVFLTDNIYIKPKKIYSSCNLNSFEKKHHNHGGILKTLKNSDIFTLDKFIEKKKISNIKLIKLDVDGSEFQVLSGGKKLIMKSRPYIIMELAPYLYPQFGYNYKDLVRLISSYGYSFFSINPIKKILDLDCFIENIKNGSSKNILLNKMI
jgi:FkbM family methyltransferase